MNKKLTIAMATYDDYDGVYFSIKSILLYHPEIINDIEFLIIDNNPEGEHGKAIQRLIEEEPIANCTYIPYTEKVSSFVKYKVFEYAKTPYVLCMDCHVLFEVGSLKKLIEYYDKNPNTNNLLQGPIIRRGVLHTHWDNEWSKSFLGFWATDERGLDPNNEPFEIVQQGMGMLSCRKDAFPKISDLFNGFGGEEGYIQGKFKERDNNTLCLPFLIWHHRFDNKKPNGPKYPCNHHDRFRNYLIGHLELKLDITELKNHFKDKVDTEEIYKELLKEIS